MWEGAGRTVVVVEACAETAPGATVHATVRDGLVAQVHRQPRVGARITLAASRTGTGAARRLLLLLPHTCVRVAVLLIFAVDVGGLLPGVASDPQAALGQAPPPPPGPETAGVLFTVRRVATAAGDEVMRGAIRSGQRGRRRVGGGRPV